MDRLRTDELQTGHEVILKDHPLYGECTLQVQNVELMEQGPICGIYKISFYEGGIEVMSNGDKMHEVESATPSKLRVVRNAQ